MSVTSASLIGFTPSLLTQHRHHQRRHQRRSIIVANSSSNASNSSSPLPPWKIDSWKTKKALQLPEYPDQNNLDEVLQTLTSFPPIVFAGEARNLEDKLSQASMGNAFLLMGGDCAESFKEFSANNIRDTFRVILQMGVVLMFGAQMPVIK
ncbi:phospho-2-dehydro-3-deoxyheptonate aldolase, partial [Trifolium pratense]